MSLNYINLTVTIVDSHIPFNTHEKKYSDNVIPGHSTHPQAPKNGRGSFKSTSWHGYPPYPEALETELVTLETIGDAVDDEPMAVISVPYIGKISCKLGLLLKTYVFGVAFSTKNNLKKNLIHSLQVAGDKLSQSGVYKITCRDWPKYYIGQTVRALATRYKDHIITRSGRATRSSTFAKHLVQMSHSPNPLGRKRVASVCT
ncbi:uncharacterized protein LOC126293231 [Schistocerca gregaria]|uniref:uncharacterized protein LOC126293231 n=1 Tax=Schistocerca gregaria TaxID=7010 RepID=UPI00211E6B29|nr:uncharacterized protein LOC126293231 [Schistocerca gregaria]